LLSLDGWIAAVRNPLAAAVERTRLLVRRDHDGGRGYCRALKDGSRCRSSCSTNS
jgi:hypothetical protein